MRDTVIACWAKHLPAMGLALLLGVTESPSEIRQPELLNMSGGESGCTKGFKRKYCPKSDYGGAICPPELRYNKCKSTEGTGMCGSGDGDTTCDNDYRCSAVDEDDLSENHSDCEGE